jgi:hypothetical protein
MGAELPGERSGEGGCVGREPSDRRTSVLARRSFLCGPGGGADQRAGLIALGTDSLLVPCSRLLRGVILLLGRRPTCRADRRRDANSGCRRARGRVLGRARLRFTRGQALRAGGSSRTRPRGRLVGGHVHVPLDAVRGVGSPDWVDSSFGWVLPGCGASVRPLPRLVHRRRFTVLCWSRDGTAPAPHACGWPFRDPGPLCGGRRGRCRPHRRALLAFACRLIVGPASSQPQGGKEPAQETARSFLDLRCFIGSPTDGSRLPS